MKKCKQGYYYCYDEKKCKKIPTGYRVGLGGWLRKEKEEEKSEDNGETETKKNGNGSNGNGEAVSEGWSEKYKKSIDCKNPKGFSQRAHCQGRKKVNEAKEKGDHEVSMAQSQLKKSEENIRKLRKALGTKEKNIPAWVQAKITDTEHNTDAASSYMDEGKRDGKSAKDKDYSLRDWFKGGGWVQAGGKYDGKPCAKQPGQKTKPFCRDADDRAAMSKDEREKRAKKKRKEDPNPNRKGKAKMVREQIDTSGQSFNRVFVKAVKNAGGKPEDVIPSTTKSANSKMKKESYSDWREEISESKPYQPGDTIPDSATKPQIKKKPKFSVDKTGLEGPENPLGEETKKDACYKKVKARYDVWPSAYASGALSKCRKVGAANWGNSTKKEGYEFSNWRDDFVPTEIETTDLITPDPIQVPPSNLQKIEEKCWVGYKQLGMKKKGKKMVPNCVKEGQSNWREELAESGYDSTRGRGEGRYQPTEYLKVDPKKYADDMKWWRENLKNAPPVRQASTKKTTQVAHFEPEGELIEDWQKENRKDNTDGMSPEAVKAYRRENPESKLQTAVTEKNPKGKRKERRKSFCDRSDGQRKMHNIDCSKTPEKKICKARKRWRC
jgi:hypothetical protein